MAGRRGVGLTSLAHMHVDVEIDRRDAGLRRAMRAAFVPRSGPRLDIPDICEPQATPLRQRTRTRACELPGQHDLFAAFVGTDDVRAELAVSALGAGHLLLAEDGTAEGRIGGGGHGNAFKRPVASNACGPSRFGRAESSCSVPIAMPQLGTGLAHQIARIAGVFAWRGVTATSTCRRRI